MDGATVAIFWALAAAVCYSVLDLLRKRLTRGVRAAPLLLYLSAGQVPAFAFWWWQTGLEQASSGYWMPALTSVVLNVGANLALLHAVRISPLSLTIPLLSLIPAFTTLLAIPILGEVPSPRQFMGIALVVLGALAIGAERRSGRGLLAFCRGILAEKGSALVVLVAVIWSITTPLDKVALGFSNAPYHGLILNFGVAVGTALFVFRPGRRSELRVPAGLRLELLYAILFSIAALAFQLIAIQITWVGLVETLKRAVGSGLALGLGRAVFEEKVSWVLVGAVVVMTTGVALILV